MLVRSSRTASRSDSPRSDCSTITVAITSPGIDGRPRPEGNRSANIASGNNRRRCSARNPSTDPGATRWPHSAAASNSSRSGSLDPSTPPVFSIPTRQRGDPHTGLFSSVLAPPIIDVPMERPGGRRRAPRGASIDVVATLAGTGNQPPAWTFRERCKDHQTVSRYGAGEGNRWLATTPRSRLGA